MKKGLFLIGLLAIILIVTGCPKKTPPPVVEEPAPVVEEPVVPPPPPQEPPPPPPAPEIREGDFATVYFDFDKSNIRGDQKMRLDANIQILKKNPELVIKIEGHCDERGTVEYNLALGDKRAVAVKDYLITNGIAARRVETISYGKERPVDPGHTEAAWAKNRRADFRIIKK